MDPFDADPVTVTWHAVDLKTGARGQQVTVQSSGTIGRQIGESSDTSLDVLCWDEEQRAPIPDWDATTLPGRSMLVAVNQDGMPVWGGMVLRRRSTEAPWVSVDLSTLEAYFDRRYVTDHTYTATSQGAIVAGILASTVIPTGVQFVVDADSATLRDRTYADDDDKTALSVLQELMAVDGGPEFTVDLEWADDDQTLLNRIVRVRDRIGTASVLPIARFEMPGSVVSFDYTEDYTSDNGANDVMATSSGEGDVRPVSAHQVATDLLANGWVRYEYRFTPSTSITNVSTLNAHAAATLREVKDGLAELSLVCNLDEAPRVDVDFWLGDDVTAVLTCPRFPEQVGPDGDLIAGYTKTVRCIGWEMDFGGRTLTPTLLEVG